MKHLFSTLLLLTLCISAFTQTVQSLTLPDGSKFEGEVLNGKPNGKGSATFTNGETYTGEWVDGRVEGKGLYTNSDGSVYTGDFKDKNADGQGTIVWPNGNSYSGGFKDDDFDGQGTYKTADGNSYTGEWKRGKRDGYGTMIWSSGNKHEGEWKDNKPNGQGTRTYNNGNRYTGGWKDGKFNGQGTYFFADGRKESGIWVDGELTTVKSGPVLDISKIYIKEPPASYEALFLKNNETFSEKSEYFRKNVKENNTEKALAFLERGALPYRLENMAGYGELGNGTNPLYPAVDNDNFEILDAVYKKYPECIRYSQLLHYACAKKELDAKMIDFLIERGASLDLNGWARKWGSGWEGIYSWNGDCRYQMRPIDCAFGLYWRLQTVDYLIEKYGQKVSPTAVAYNLVKVILRDFSEEKIINWIDNYYSRYVDFKDYVNLGISAMSYDGYIDASDYNPRFALVAAIASGKNRVAKHLIDLGADVNISYHYSAREDIGIGFSDTYHSPLYEAIRRKNNLEMINYLLDHGAKPYKDVIKQALPEYREEFILRGLLD